MARGARKKGPKTTTKPEVTPEVAGVESEGFTPAEAPVDDKPTKPEDDGADAKPVYEEEDIREEAFGKPEPFVPSGSYEVEAPKKGKETDAEAEGKDEETQEISDEPDGDDDDSAAPEPDDTETVQEDGDGNEAEPDEIDIPGPVVRLLEEYDLPQTVDGVRDLGRILDAAKRLADRNAPKQPENVRDEPTSPQPPPARQQPKPQQPDPAPTAKDSGADLEPFEAPKIALDDVFKGVDREMFDDLYVETIKNQVNKMNEALANMHQAYSRRLDAISSDSRSIRETFEQRELAARAEIERRERDNVEQQLDTCFTQLGDEWKEVFGGEKMRHTDKNSDAFKNRMRVVATMSGLHGAVSNLEGNEQLTTEQLFKQALYATFGHRIESNAVKKVSAKVDKRRKQRIASPTARVKGKASSGDALLDNINDVLSKHNVGLGGTSIRDLLPA